MTKRWDAQRLRDWILAQQEPLAFAEVRSAARRFGAADPDRAADRALQKLRREGALYHRARMWSRVVAAVEPERGGVAR